MLPIDHHITFLYTHDLTMTAAFYEDTMGLSLARDQGDCRIYQLSTTAYIGFCQRASAPAKPEGIIICLVTADQEGVDKWYNDLTEKGIAFEKVPTLNPTYNIYHSFLRDPNGYLLEIQCFLETP